MATRALGCITTVSQSVQSDKTAITIITAMLGDVKHRLESSPTSQWKSDSLFSTRRKSKFRPRIVYINSEGGKPELL